MSLETVRGNKVSKPLYRGFHQLKRGDLGDPTESVVQCCQNVEPQWSRVNQAEKSHEKANFWVAHSIETVIWACTVNNAGHGCVFSRQCIRSRCDFWRFRIHAILHAVCTAEPTTPSTRDHPQQQENRANRNADRPKEKGNKVVMLWNPTFDVQISILYVGRGQKSDSILNVLMHSNWSIVCGSSMGWMIPFTLANLNRFE